MKKFLLPVLLVILGLGVGAGAGWFLQPAPQPVAEETPSEDTDTAPSPAPSSPVGADRASETLRLPGQFLIPVIGDGRIRAMVVIGLALEVVEDHDIDLDRHEARLRAALLQAMFDHSNRGGFDGVYTDGETLHAFRRTLRAIARTELGERVVLDVLITDLVRQNS